MCPVTCPSRSTRLLRRRPSTEDDYEINNADQQMKATGMGQLVGEFLLDREGIIRWSFTEVPDGGKNMFGAPTPQDECRPPRTSPLNPA